MDPARPIPAELAAQSGWVPELQLRRRRDLDRALSDRTLRDAELLDRPLVRGLQPEYPERPADPRWPAHDQSAWRGVGLPDWTPIRTSDGSTGSGLHGNHYQKDWEQSWSARAALEWKPGARLSFRVEPQIERIGTSAQYVDTFDDVLAASTLATAMSSPTLDQTTVSASVRLNWIFTPKLSLEVYAQPLASSGRYTGFKELARPAELRLQPLPRPGRQPADPDRLVVDPDGTGPAPRQEIDDPNFSLVSLRGNAVLRWEYLPGSTLFLVWTQNRSDSESIGSFSNGSALGRLASTPGDNIFLVKISYWWNP